MRVQKAAIRHLNGPIFVLLSALFLFLPFFAQAAAPDFSHYIESLWPQARAHGVSRATFDAAFKGVTFDPKIVALTKKQAEFVRPIWSYLDSAVSNARLARGRDMAEEWKTALKQAESRYGVPKEIILSVWGMETNFGSFTGKTSTIRALATLAFARYRGDFFHDELLAALQILQGDHIEPDRMKGSWAGAMGQTQFMPSSFLKYAVDGDGDGARDIWNSAPDAIASTANYLKQHGWDRDSPWGIEVVLPNGIDLRHDRAAFRDWARLGVKRADGGALPRSGEAQLFLPAGVRAPAFLLTENYGVIKSYNSSDAYALAVGHLGDRLGGGADIQGDWPKAEPQLDQTQRIEVQKRLKALGFYTGETDGRLGSKTRDALRAYQLKHRLMADGYADVAMWRDLKTRR